MEVQQRSRGLEWAHTAAKTTATPLSHALVRTVPAGLPVTYRQILHYVLCSAPHRQVSRLVSPLWTANTPQFARTAVLSAGTLAPSQPQSVLKRWILLRSQLACGTLHNPYLDGEQPTRAHRIGGVAAQLAALSTLHTARLDHAMLRTTQAACRLERRHVMRRCPDVTHHRCTVHLLGCDR